MHESVHHPTTQGKTLRAVWSERAWRRFSQREEIVLALFGPRTTVNANALGTQGEFSGCPYQGVLQSVEMDLQNLNEEQILRLNSRRADLRAAAMSYALNPEDYERLTILLATAHEFGKTLDSIGLKDYWTIQEAKTPPCP